MGAFLIYIATLSTSGGVIERHTAMVTMSRCLEAVKAAQVHVPSGGDAETTVTLYCSHTKPDEK